MSFRCCNTARSVPCRGHIPSECCLALQGVLLLMLVLENRARHSPNCFSMRQAPAGRHQRAVSVTIINDRSGNDSWGAQVQFVGQHARGIQATLVHQRKPRKWSSGSARNPTGCSVRASTHTCCRRRLFVYLARSGAWRLNVKTEGQGCPDSTLRAAASLEAVRRTRCDAAGSSVGRGQTEHDATDAANERPPQVRSCCIAGAEQQCDGLQGIQ